MFAHFLFLSKFPGNHCPARLSRVMLNLKHAANSIAPLVHAPAWGATDGQHVAVRYAEFQSTHPRGVRRLRSGGLARHGQVSIHAPAWGATFLKTGSRTDYPMFQSTHPRGVRHAGSISHHSALSRFNPRTRVGCDLVFPFILIPHFSVSIHAPAWGATSTSRRSRRLMWVSIHAPAWGATSKPVAISPCRMMVSIHAPAWGATAERALVTAASRGFNPRTRVGCDSFHVLSSRFP